MSMLKLEELIYSGICTSVGNTPLAQFKRLNAPQGLQVFGKLESLNPWGSMKDRVALQIMRDAIRTGAVGPETVVVESTSGNLGISLAHICHYLGLQFICVVDERINAATKSILKLLGAEIQIVRSQVGNSDTLLKLRLERVKDIRTQYEDVFWPNQYGNRSNPLAHMETMREICTQLGSAPDMVIVPISTCGALRGIAEYVSKHGLQTSVIAVDAAGSVTGPTPGKRILPGHGSGIVPELYSPELAEHHIYVSDAECIVGCQRLLHEESLIAGASSGAAVMALQKVTPVSASGTCVLILPDRGERYMDTVFSESWVNAFTSANTVMAGEGCTDWVTDASETKGKKDPEMLKKLVGSSGLALEVEQETEHR